MDHEAASCVAVFRRERALRRSQDRIRRAGVPERREGHGNIVWIEFASRCLSNVEPSKSGRFTTRKVGTNVNPADLMTKPLAKPEIEQLMGIMGYGFMEMMWTQERVDRKERDDVSATWVSKNSCTLVKSCVLRDSSSGDNVVRDCWGAVCGEVVKDEGALVSV